MEMTKEDFELFMQFKQFMATNGNMKPVQEVKKGRREKGTGSVTKLSGNRKRPFLASVTMGYDEWSGKQIQKPLAYFSDRKNAERALDLYILEKDGKCSTGTLLEYIYSVDGSLPKEKVNTVNLNNDTVKIPFGKSNCPTFEEIWKKLLITDLSHLSDRAIMNYRVSFNHFRELHNRKIDTIRLCDIQPYFDELMEKGTGQSKMNNMKIVLNYIFKYGCKYDYIEKNYAEYIRFKETLSKEDKKNKVPFTKDNIKLLFQHDDDLIVQSIIVMIYTGMRPSELLQLRKENIHIEERYMIGGIKTKSGIDRIIPIHECIVKYVENISKSKLLNMKYHTYLNYFNEIKNKFIFNCTPHSGRHTFASLANEYGLNEFLIKRIMGHSSKDLTKDVYTHVDIQRLIEEINKIPVLN